MSDALVSAFIAMPCMADVSSRNAVLSMLPHDVVVAIPRGTSTDKDVEGIVNTCINKGVLSHLVEAIAFFDDGMIQMKNLIQIVM